MKEEELESEFKTLKENVLKLNEHIKDIDPDCKLYKGIQLLMTRKLVYEPDIMFIGINPGDGYFKANKTPVNQTEVTCTNNGGFYKKRAAWPFVKLMSRLFENEDDFYKLRDNDKLLWTNCFPIATTTERDLRLLLDIVDKDSWEKDPLHKSLQRAYPSCHRYIHQLAELVNPKIIICLGKVAFDEFVNEEFTKTNDFIKSDTIIPPTSNEMYCLFKNKIPVVGFKRYRSSFKAGVDKKWLQMIIKETISK